MRALRHFSWFCKKLTSEYYIDFDFKKYLAKHIIKLVETFIPVLMNFEKSEKSPNTLMPV